MEGPQQEKIMIDEYNTQTALDNFSLSIVQYGIGCLVV